MPKTISPKITALTFGVLTIAFLAVFYVVAWQEPTQAPPGGNVAPPLNTSNVAQIKEGGLVLNTGGASNGLVVDKGKICIGIDCRDNWPATGAITTYRMTVSGYSVDDSYYASKTASYTCPDGSTPAVTYCKSIIIPETSIDACSCSGSTLKAYVQTNRMCDNYASPYIAASDSCQLKDTVSPSGIVCNTDCGVPGTCEIEFQCGKKETVGTYSAETCSAPDIILSGGSCGQANDDCNTKCASVGWRQGSSVSCSPNVDAVMSGNYKRYNCGLTYPAFDYLKGGSGHNISCQCSN